MALSEHLLQVQYPSRTRAVSSSRSEGAGLEIFFPTRQRGPLGRQVKMLVTFEDSVEPFELSGRVTFVRAGTSAGQEPGVGVSFDGDHRRRAAELLAYCSGTLPPEDGKGIAKRVYTKLRCRVVFGADKYPAEVVDLSATGTFVSAPTAPRLKVGSKIVMQFKAGLLSWGKELELKVMWYGEKRGQGGFGGKFLGDPAHIANEITQYLRAAGAK